MPDGSNLEYVVRPFSAPNAHGAIIIPSTPTGSREKATLTWGRSTQLPDAQTGVGFSVVCCKDTLGEQSRENYETQRIYQNNDDTSDNWIDYAPAKTLELSKKEKNTCGDNLDDISTVTQEINADLAGFESLMSQSTGTSDKNCGAQWNFKAPS